MGFGSFLGDMVKSASGAALDSARSVANWTVEKAEQAHHAYEAGKTVAAEKATGAFADVLGGLKAGLQKKDAAVAAAKASVKDAVQATRQRINAAVDKVFGRKPKSPPPPSSPAVTACVQDEVARKARTRAARQEVIAKAFGTGDPALKAKADRLARDMDAVEDARLSNHIYCLHDPAECNSDNAQVPGFNNVSGDKAVLAKLGLQPGDLELPGSNFKAAVFERRSPPFGPNETGYVIAFKGTSPGSVEDWQNNFRQGLDADSPFYRQAVRIGNKVSDQLSSKAGGPTVMFAGHSLGGGLASAAATASGLQANTFNSAGLNAATIARYGGNESDSGDIVAYHVPGDPLTETNVKGVSVLGIKLSQPPLAVGKSQEVPRALHDTTIPPGQDDTYFHSMPVVIRAIERRKGADEERLRAVLEAQADEP